MNNKLLEEIVRHVFASLLIIESDFIDLNSSKSLKSKDFLLKEKLDFSSDDETISNNIWGCNISSEDQEIKIILADCSLENNK
jgi:hypothetical protein